MVILYISFSSVNSAAALNDLQFYTAALKCTFQIIPLLQH